MHSPTTEDLAKIYSLLGLTKVEDTSYSKVTILGWFKDRNPQVRVTSDYAIFSGETDGNKKMYWSPIATSEQGMIEAISYLESQGVTTIINVTKDDIPLYLERGYTIEPSRDYFEYLYTPSDLIELKGKKYHAKRNFINGFNHPYEFRAYLESDREELFELLYKWSYLHIEKGVEWSAEDNWHSHVVLQKIKSDPEIKALTAVLDDLEGYNCFADILKADGKIIGFALGEILPTNVGAIYFEKGDIEYKGIYPLLDNLFSKKHFGSVKYVNKQEDMGLEGLRKSKLSYHPVKFAERYVAKKV
ncbi:MAG: DUF2156 domain-containing protein [Clostridia bacterium]|nr:DUF2156 domain-containing protein [Clostridia bacterium]